MSLEEDINRSNRYYLTEDTAVIHKKPTPITIVKVDYPKRSAAKITEAYFKLASTTDYNGIYKGKYIDFEAKECESRTSFPFSSIHEHQIKHLESVEKHGAIAFIIMRFVYYDKDYLIKANEFIEYYRSCNRKSLPFAWVEEHGHEIRRTFTKPCDYLSTVDKVFDL
ncbi:MAG: Holliday junction resolvase RecU [Erysipelotrichaceae bacterium]|nr:Holliday junction resolvase RecU [Erysipelotrichaceae bacterium]